MKLLPFILLLVTASQLFAQKKELSILNNRFYITFPDSAKNVARASDIMGPGPNENKETRIIYDEGDKRLVFFARELNVKTVPAFADALKKETTATNPLTLKEIYNSGAVKILELTPGKFDNTKNAILISSLIIQNADSTLSRMDAFVNPSAFVEKTKFTEIVKQAFSTFRPGNRTINFHSHVDTLNIMGTTSKAQVKLPENYIIQVDHGEDFEVFNVVKLSPYGSSDGQSMIIYFGFYPSALAKEYQMENFKQPDTNNDFMLHSSKWNNYYDKEHNFALREQIFQDDEIENGMKVHIALTSNNPKAIEELSGIVKNLVIMYGPSPAK